MSPAKRLVFWLILIGFVAAMGEGMAWAVVALWKPHYDIVRRILAGDESRVIVHAQNTVGQAYLLYIAAPGYVDAKGVVQHNEDGYRGARVPLSRTPGVARILFLGGSTTYDWQVDHPDSTYPARIGQMLRAYRPPGIRDVEVINGGLPWGTSAEQLTHYLFKYRYYRPDLVVLDTGGNDAQANIIPAYHPDYSHWRQPIRNLEPLRARARWLMHSRLVSLFVVNLFFSEYLDGQHFINTRTPAAGWYDRLSAPNGQDIFVQRKEKPAWYNRVVYDPGEPQAIPDDDLAFTRNIRTLIREIRVDQGRVLLIPFRENPQGSPYGYFYTESFLKQVYRHEAALRRIAGEENVAFAPFPGDIISKENWADDCHLNNAGAREKAAHFLPYVRGVLWPETP